MITIVQGKVGDGKSYHMTTLIVDHLLRGGVVATNLNLDLNRIRKNFHRRLFDRQYLHISAESSPFEIPRGDFRGRGFRRVMVVLDEALNWFASQGGAKDDRKATWGEWLRQSDKLGQDVYFIAQNFERAAKWIRELSQTLISIANLRNISLFKMPFGKWFHLKKLYAVSTFDVRAESLISWSLKVIEARYYQCYDTSQLWGFPASSNAYDGLAVPPAFKLPFWPFLLFILWVLLLWVFL